MARQFLGAAAVIADRKIRQGAFPRGIHTWVLDKNLSGNAKDVTISVSGASTTTNATALFSQLGKISKGGPGGTKVTILEVRCGNTAGSGSGGAQPATNAFLTSGSFKFYIDWEAKKVICTGSYSPSLAKRDGRKAAAVRSYVMSSVSAVIPEAEGQVTIKGTIYSNEWGDPGAKSSQLTAIKLNPITRSITGLPLFPTFTFPAGDQSMGSQAAEWSLLSYAVETDDYQTTTVAPTPDPTPDPVDPGIDVSGTKISELTPATTPLDDSDLFVVSQGGADGTYDSSNNITYANLAKDTGVTAAFNSGWQTSFGGVDVENGATLEVTHDLGTVDLMVVVFAATDANGTDTMELTWQTGSLSSQDGYGAQITALGENALTLQLGLNGLLYLAPNGQDHAPGDPGGRDFSGNGQSGKRWNYIKVLCVKAG